MVRRAVAAVLAISVALPGCAPLIIGGSTGAGFVAHDARSFGTVIDDHIIEIRIRGAIDGNPQLRNQTHIVSYSENGTVLLTGEAPTPELRDQVLALVQKIPHIKRIVNQIEIGPPSSFAERAQDSWITTEVKARLLATKGVDATHIRVITSDQVVFLMGLVPAGQGQAAAESASHVPNVQKIIELFDPTP